MSIVGGIPPLDGSALDGDVSQPGASGSAQGTVRTEARDLTNQEQGQLVSILTQLSSAESWRCTSKAQCQTKCC